MAKINIKTNFVDGEKLFAQQLNNNFKAIQEGMDSDNEIIWQDGEEVLFKRYITNDIENLPIVDGSIIYDIEKGRHYIDYNGKRIQVGSSGKEVLVQDTQPIEEDNKIWIESDFVNSMGTEVVDSLDGDETNMSPSVRAVKKALLEVYSTEEQVVGTWMGKPLYKKTINFGSFPNATNKRIAHGISNIEMIPFFLYGWYDSDDQRWYSNGRTGADNVICLINIDSTSVILQGGKINWTNRTSNGNVTIYYTKTTDSEVISNEV